MLLCFAMFLSLGAARGQQSPSQQGSGEGIVADNLDRVAATAEQILDVLNRDAGLMVELKRAIAQDAGESGQILEESDLSDGAVTERLREDLRTRVLATRLLQRYGYLLPKVNPDSELAAEHNLRMRARAQQLERASEPYDSNHAAPQTVIAVGAQPSAERPANQGRAARSPLVEVDGALDNSRPEMLAAPPDVHLDLVKAGGRPSMQTEPAEHAGYAVPVETLIPATGIPSAPASRPPRGVGTSAAEFVPVRMDRRPNPYADVPSLYDLYVQANAPSQKTERFGMEVFRNGTADPDILPMDLPVGPDYVVGPGDSLAINLWGGVSQRLFREVDREGRLTLPEVGPLLVSGRSLSEVQQSVQQSLRTQFRDVSADVSLSKLRTIRVYVVGDVQQPGAYDISSLSTPLNALFYAGGPTAGGSLRVLRHFRGKELVQEVDVYDLLLHGVKSNIKRLESGDSILVPPIGAQVTVEGMVRRPAVYELRDEKNLADVLDLAGGILPAAALQHIEVERLEAHQRRSMLSLDLKDVQDKDAIKKQLESFEIQDSDEVHLFPIAPYNEDAVYLQGHVLRPGRYSYSQGMKLTDLVASYKDLLPEPAEKYAEIVRLNAPDYRPSVESFDLAAALANPAAAPALQPLDTVRIFGRYDFEDAPSVSVFGEV